MPVPKNYYTVPEAIALIGKRWPDEDDPKGALRRLCLDGDVPAWIIDEKTGARADVPPDRFFGVRRDDFRINLKSGRAALKRKKDDSGVWDQPLHPLTLSPRRTWDSGELRIGREEFDALASTPRPGNKSAGRPQKYDWDLFWAEVVKIANTPNGLPETQAELVDKMAEWCSQKWGDEPGVSTIRKKIALI